jgi:hypothetical protein
MLQLVSEVGFMMEATLHLMDEQLRELKSAVSAGQLEMKAEISGLNSEMSADQEGLKTDMCNPRRDQKYQCRKERHRR